MNRKRLFITIENARLLKTSPLITVAPQAGVGRRWFCPIRHVPQRLRKQLPFIAQQSVINGRLERKRLFITIENVRLLQKEVRLLRWRRRRASGGGGSVPSVMFRSACSRDNQTSVYCVTIRNKQMIRNNQMIRNRRTFEKQTSVITEENVCLLRRRRRRASGGDDSVLSVMFRNA